MNKMCLLIALTLGCGGTTGAGTTTPQPPPSTPTAETSSTTETPAPADELLPNERLVREGLLTGGQPNLAQIASLSEAGYQTVISLRGADEVGADGEQEAVEASGMRFVSVPISGANDLTVISAERLHAELARSEGPVVLHCGSGNRAGAMVALMALIHDGASVEEALELGRAAGLTALGEATEQTLREICQDLPEGDCGDE